MQANSGRFYGAFLSQGELTLHENGIHAVGDTMGGGKIFLHGDAGDAAGYGMWGGNLYIKGNAGKRAGMHMKANAVVLIGGRAGDFLGEYQAGGIVILLGLEQDGPLWGEFPFAGFHGGKVYVRGSMDALALPCHVRAKAADESDLEHILPHLDACCLHFGWDRTEILSKPFTVLTPKTHRPYKSLYTPA